MKIIRKLFKFRSRNEMFFKALNDLNEQNKKDWLISPFLL